MSKEIKLDSEVEEALAHFDEIPLLWRVDFATDLNTIKQSLSDKDREIEELKQDLIQSGADLECCYDELHREVEHPLQSKLNAIEKVIKYSGRGADFVSNGDKYLKINQIIRGEKK